MILLLNGVKGLSEGQRSRLFNISTRNKIEYLLCKIRSKNNLLHKTTHLNNSSVSSENSTGIHRLGFLNQLTSTTETLTLYSVWYIKAYQNDNANKQAKVSIKTPTLAILLISQRHTVYQRKDRKKQQKRYLNKLPLPKNLKKFPISSFFILHKLRLKRSLRQQSSVAYFSTCQKWQV